MLLSRPISFSWDFPFFGFSPFSPAICTPLLTNIPMASSIILHTANAFIAPLPIWPIPIAQIESMELTYSLTDSRIICIAECQANSQHCHRLANRHGICQRVCQNARSPPVRSLPYAGSNLPSLSSSSFLWTTLEQPNFRKEGTR